MYDPRILTDGVEQIIDQASLVKRLENGRPLRIKLGIDPTSPKLHLGHAALLKRLRTFQDLGHKAVLVIGDLTASVGDPSGVNKTRPMLTKAQISQNMKTYLKQAGRILDLKKAEVVYNSKHLNKIDMAALIGWAGKLSLNNLIEREDFKRRLNNHESVGLHELVYPLLQAIDSVELKIDMEMGGGDQRLNFLVARELQKKCGQQPEEVFLMELLLGLDGQDKMSSSKGNDIALDATPDEMFGLLMRLPDKAVLSASRLLLDSQTQDNLAKMADPREQKAQMAEGVVAWLNSVELATRARERFDQTFRHKKIDDSLVKKLKLVDGSTLTQAVVAATSSSRSEAHRLITQGAVRLDDQQLLDSTHVIDLDQPRRLQVGKHRFFEILKT